MTKKELSHPSSTCRASALVRAHVISVKSNVNHKGIYLINIIIKRKNLKNSKEK